MPRPRQSTSRHPQTSSSRSPPTRLENLRTGIQNLFSGRSSVGTRAPNPEGPKTPRPTLGPQRLPSTRLVIPYLTRSESERSRRSPRTPRTPYTPLSSRPITPNSFQQQTQQPNVSTIPPQVRHNSHRRFVSVDPAEQELADLVQQGRRRRGPRTRQADRHCCAPKIKNKKIRSKILSCFISGIILALVLTIYLALALSNKNEPQEFHVLLILIILVTTIFFCHSLIRLCMLIIHPPVEPDLEQQLPPMTGIAGYANPASPIRVTLARDEEAAGIESEATKLPPPAYGLWRESVRVDPNRIFWQRNDAAAREHQNREERPTTANRPPSYISEDGVDYVIEAQGRSIAPTTDVPLPLHPAERGRVWIP